VTTTTRRVAPRAARTDPKTNSNLRSTIPTIEDEPPDFMAPKSAEDTSSLKDSIKDATEGNYRPGKYKAPVMKMYGVAAIGLMPFVPQTALQIAEAAEKCAEEWEKLARRNPAVRKVLDVLTENTGRFALAAAHAPILVAAARETGVAEKVVKSSVVQRLMDRFTPKKENPETWQDNNGFVA